MSQEYHKADLNHAVCLRCHKPMSQWKASDFCPIEKKDAMLIDQVKPTLIQGADAVSLHTPHWSLSTNGRLVLLILGTGQKWVFLYEDLEQFLEGVKKLKQ